MEGLDNGATSAAPAPPGASLEGDNLTELKGIGDDSAARLRAAGVTTFRQLAELNIDDAERLEEATGMKGRITNFYWRDQAQARLQAASLPPRMRPSRAAGQVMPPPPEEEDEPEAEAPAPDPQVTSLLKQVEELQRQLKLQPRRQPPAQSRFSRVVPLAHEAPRRRRLNENRKYSDIIGVDTQLTPPGTIWQQVVTEDGEKRVAYFAGDGIQRFMSDEDLDDIDFNNVEPPHEVTIDTVHARNYLNGRVNYPFSLMAAYMKERFSFEARSPKDVKEELHRMINRNRS